MNLLQQFQLATQAYLKRAYPSGPPTKIREKTEELRQLEDISALLSWPEFEVEDSRYQLRLGNQSYPHMKLVFLLEDNRPLFYVDAHDSHFNLPPDMPGYDQLLQLREENKRLKSAIEAAWTSEDLPIFGHQVGAVKYKKLCQDLIVLAVDDEVQILDMLGIIISSLGACFLRAHSAEEAREILATMNTPPSLVFCDIMMPGESGFDFVAWLRETYPLLTIYFITGLTQEKIGQIEIAPVLQKPFSAKNVMSILKNLD